MGIKAKMQSYYVQSQILCRQTEDPEVTVTKLKKKEKNLRLTQLH